MIRRILTILFCWIGLAVQGQVLRDLNYSYLYDPGEIFSMNWKVVRLEKDYQAVYEFQLNDTTRKTEDFTITWETRKSLSEKNGETISADPQILKKLPGKVVGKLNFTAGPEQTLLVAIVTVVEQKKSRLYSFYKKLPQHRALLLSTGQSIMLNSYIHKNQPVTFEGFTTDRPLQIFFYTDPFPAAAPAFSTAMAKVSKTIKPDSTFSTNPEAAISFDKKGLYLAQQDTSSTEGLAFRVEEDYPKFGKLASLAGPLIYICTKQEFERLKLAGNDKKKFDQTILTITGNAERARTFMRSYFKRVELANVFFSSYKEGWKTDRGMIFIIYGIPEEVYLFEDREVWEYKNETVKIRFQFVKSATIFDPENFVLARDKKFSDSWYQMVDLWRKARF